VVAFPWPETQPDASQWPDFEDRPFPDTFDNMLHREPEDTTALDRIVNRMREDQLLDALAASASYQPSQVPDTPIESVPVQVVADGVDHTYHQHIGGRFIDTRTGVGGASSPRGSRVVLPNVAAASGGTPTTTSTISLPRKVFVSAAIVNDRRCFHVRRDCRSFNPTYDIKEATLCKVCLAEVRVGDIDMLP